MNRQDLKDYRYNEIHIKRRIEKLREDKSTIDNMSSIASDMPKRKQKSTRYYS